jgi:multiple sugar transport system permease protein
MLVIKQIRAGFHSASALSTIVFLIIAIVAWLFIQFGGADVIQRPPASKKKKKDEEISVKDDAAGIMAQAGTPGA